MNTYSTINDIEQAILQVGDTVRILGERTEGDIATMTGRVRAEGTPISNRVVYSKNGLPIEVFPVPATEATKEFVEGEIHDFHTDTVKDVWQAGQRITSWVHKIYQDGEYRIPKTVPFITKATWESDKVNWVILDSEQSTLRKVFGSEPITLTNGLVITPVNNQYPKLAAFGAIYELADNSASYTVKSFIKNVDGDCVITLSDGSTQTARKIMAANNNVLALGSTTSRTLPERFADFVNAKDEGVLGGGVHDDTDAAKRASLKAEYVFYPDGIYKITEDISGKAFSFSQIQIVGGGSLNLVTCDSIRINAEKILKTSSDIANIDGRLTLNESATLSNNNTLKEHTSDIIALKLSQSSGTVGYATRSELYADLNHAEHTVAYVTNDATATFNGTYRKVGAVGAGSWSQANTDLASQAYQISSQNKHAVSHSNVAIASNSQAGILRKEWLRVSEGTVTVGTNGRVDWQKGSTANPVMEFDDGISQLNIYSNDADYISLGNIGKSSVFIGVSGGSFGRIQHSNGDGTFTNIVNDVKLREYIGEFMKIIYVNGLISVFQSADGSDYSEVMRYDVNSIDRPEISEQNRRLGVVYKTNGIFRSATFGNPDKVSVVSNIPDQSNEKDSLSLYGAKILDNRISYLADNLPSREVSQKDVSTPHDASIVVNQGSISLTKGSSAYPTIEIESYKNVITYTRGLAEYVLLSVSDSKQNSIAATITGGGVGYFFDFVNGNSFSNIGSIPDFNHSAPTTFIRQSILDNGNILVEGAESHHNPDFIKIFECDWSKFNPYDNNKSLGFIAKTSGLQVSKCSIGEALVSSTVTGNWSGKSWAALGDSITEYADYIPPVLSNLDLSSVQNLGVAGSTITPEYDNSIPARCRQISGSPELITVFGGTNDFGKSYKIGTIDDAAGSKTFFGGLKDIAEYLVKAYPTSRIFFVNILHRDWQKGGSQVAGLVNNNGDSVEDFNNAILQVARLYSIPLIDLYQDSGISLHNIGTFLVDRLHPNKVGGQRVGDTISMNIANFKN